MSNPFFKILRFAVFLLMAIILLLAICGGTFFLLGGNDTVTYTEDVAIVLGCGVEGTEPSAQLKYRLDTALAYAEKNPAVCFIVSGGQGSDEDDTEASVMARYLVEHGMPAEQILLEDQAASTAENFRFSAVILEEQLPEYKTVCFITSDFHIFRSGLLAKKMGLENMTHLHAPTPSDRIAVNLFREPIVFIKSLLFD